MSFSLGFYTLSLELAKYSKKVDWEFYSNDIRAHTAIDGDRLQKTLQQMFASQADHKDDGLRLSKEEYMKYKKSYAKHLQFNPNIQNLSKFKHQLKKLKIYPFPASLIKHTPLQSVYI